jgi:hypothetical protein
MDHWTPWRRLVALGLGVLLASCGTPRHAAPASNEALTARVLVIQVQPDGQVLHSWRQAESFNLSQYSSRAGAPQESGRLVLASGQKRDCHAEYLECHRGCKNAPLPPGYEHIPRGSTRHDSFCWERCKQPYLDCEKLQELQPQEFTAVDGALDWLKRNHKTLLVGSTVVIAGVVFVVVTSGAGLLVLAPVVVLASSAAVPTSAPYTSEVSP